MIRRLFHSPLNNHTHGISRAKLTRPSRVVVVVVFDPARPVGESALSPSRDRNSSSLIMSVDAANRRVKSIAAHVGANASATNSFGSYRGAASVRRVVAKDVAKSRYVRRRMRECRMRA